MKIKVVEYEAPEKFSEWLEHIGATILLKDLTQVKAWKFDWEAQIEDAAFIWRGTPNPLEAYNSISGHGNTPESAVQDLYRQISTNRELKIILNEKTIQVPSNLQWDNPSVLSTDVPLKISVLDQVGAKAVLRARDLILPGLTARNEDYFYAAAALNRVAEKMVSGS